MPSYPAYFLKVASKLLVITFRGQRIQTWTIWFLMKYFLKWVLCEEIIVLNRGERWTNILTLNYILPKVTFSLKTVIFLSILIPNSYWKHTQVILVALHCALSSIPMYILGKWFKLVQLMVKHYYYKVW